MPSNGNQRPAAVLKVHLANQRTQVFACADNVSIFDKLAVWKQSVSPTQSH